MTDVAEALAAIGRHLARGDLTCLLCDRDAAFPLDASWRERLGATAFAGAARTVLAPNGELASVREAVRDLAAGEVLVVHGPPDRAIFGGNLAAAARERGAAGAVISGLVRDVTELERAAPFGLVARGRRARRSDPDARGGRDVPVAIGRTSVRPGDLIVVDANDAVRVASGAATEIASRLDAWVAAEDG